MLKMTEANRILIVPFQHLVNSTRALWIKLQNRRQSNSRRECDDRCEGDILSVYFAALFDLFHILAFLPTCFPFRPFTAFLPIAKPTVGRIMKHGLFRAGPTTQSTGTVPYAKNLHESLVDLRKL
jgi:hypothetical protein